MNSLEVLSDSVSAKTTPTEDVDYVLEVLPRVVEKLRQLSPLNKHNALGQLQTPHSAA